MSGGGYDGKIAGLYDLEETLGRGHYAVVKLARHVFTGEKVAVKVIDKIRLDEVSRSHLFQEVRCMKLVQHPNVVRLYEVIDTQTKLYLILELADGGDMYDYIMKHDTGLDECAAKKYFRQIVHAISFCHRLHVVHRDLKPENVVFFEKLGMVKLTDFGFSNKFCPGQKLETSCGSLAYSAPEILLGDSYDAPAVDIWSLGVILYMLVVGRAPFQEVNDSETLTRIMDCDFTTPDHVSKPCRNLIRKMLIRDPDRRSTLEDIANDEWLLSDSSEVDMADILPLVSRQHLTEEDHAHIIHKMVAGAIASMDEILEALDKNEYNHITATYFLLAERKLRNYRIKQADLAQKGDGSIERSSSGSLNESSVMMNSTMSPSEHEPRIPMPPQSKDDSASITVHSKLSEARGGVRLRTFSILEEEDEEEQEEGGRTEEEEEEEGKRSRSGSRRGSRASSTSSLKEKCLRDIKLDMSLLHRLECVRRGSASTQGSAATSPSADEFLLLPQPPFPPTSNLGLGRGGGGGRTRSAASSPVTTPPSSLFGVAAGVSLSPPPPARPRLTTPQSSLSSSPTSAASSPSSPGPAPPLVPPAPSSPKTQAGLFSPKFKTLPSPNRRLHSVRSSPQLVLNEIFEEGESDGESGGGGPPQPPHTLALQTVASPSVMRRRHRIARSRTASGSSSEASDDEEARKRPPLSRRCLREGADEPMGPPSSEAIPKVTLSPAPSLPDSPSIVASQGLPRSGASNVPATGVGGCRPLSATCEDERKARLLAETTSGGSTENVLDIDTTLRESRSLNCIVGEGGGGTDPPLHPPPLEQTQTSASFDEATIGVGAPLHPGPANITISSDNITTIYIEDHHFWGDTPPGSETAPGSDPPEDRVVIQVIDGAALGRPNGGPLRSPTTTLSGGGSDPNHYFTLPITSTHRPPLNASEIFLGLEDSHRPRLLPTEGGNRSPRCPGSGPPAKKTSGTGPSRFSLSCLSSSSSNPALPHPPSPWPFGLHIRSAPGCQTPAGPPSVAPSHPVMSQPAPGTSLSSALSKSASHLEALRGAGPLAPHKLRTSATNGSLASGHPGYLTDINQNAGGGRKSRSEKQGGGSLALHGTSKCCALS